MNPIKKIKINHISSGYGEHMVLRDLSLDIHAGEILTLIGPNGAGKSTLLKTLGRDIPCSSGSMTWISGDGRETALQDILRGELAQRVSILFTEKLRTEYESCQEVVESGRYPYTGRFGRLTEQDQEKVQEAMELVHVLELKRQSFRSLSDGQRQRVMLARAIAQEPELLLLDEPTTYLDIHYKTEFLSILRDLSRRRGITVVLSMHEIELAALISDRIAVLREGVLERVGVPEEILTPEYMKTLYDITETMGERYLEAVLPCVQGLQLS